MAPTTGFANGRAGEVSKEEKLAAIQRQVEDGSLVVRKTAATPTVVDHERRAKRAEEAGRPDDLSDLELSEHELALEHCYDQARANGNGQVLNAIEDFWDPGQLERLRKLLRVGDGASWAVGDHVLAMVPQGRSRAANGAFARLRELAGRCGCEFATLRRARAVAFAWPAEHRVAGISMAAHGAWCEGGPAEAGDRARVLCELRDRNGGALTADLVRVSRGYKRCRELRDPIRSLAGRIDRAHALLEMLPDEPTRHTPPAALRRRAEQARDIADRLEALAA